MIERSHLSIIREVERQGSLTAAAESLCLTQSALSHSMRKLEHLLGTEVWLREGRSLHLTQAGQYLLDLANRLLPQLERAEEQLQQYAIGHRGTLRIGMECHPCYEWLLRVVSPYLDAWPDVDVDVKQKFQFGGIGALFAHEIDLLVTPDPLYKPGLHFEAVFDYEQVLVVSSTHPLPSSTKPLKPLTSCCKWWQAIAAWRLCRVGWWQRMVSVLMWWRYRWGKTAYTSRFIWVHVKRIYTPNTCTAFSNCRASRWWGDHLFEMSGGTHKSGL